MKEYLVPTPVIDYHHASIQSFIKRFDERKVSKELAIDVFYSTRDGFPYYPYYIDFSINGSKASNLTQKKKGHCIDKALFFIACCRALHIPARIGLAKVKNHIATEKLEEYLRSNIMIPHGYAEIYVEKKWIKVTPAFNKELCKRLAVSPLDFDGENDCLFQAYDSEGKTFMTYIEDYGVFPDFPISLAKNLFKMHYPHLSPEKGDLYSFYSRS